MLTRAAKYQTPAAIALAAILVAEVVLRVTTGEGLGAPELVYAAVAALAGGLGLQRPSEALGRRGLPVISTAGGDPAWAERRAETGHAPGDRESGD